MIIDNILNKIKKQKKISKFVITGLVVLATIMLYVFIMLFRIYPVAAYIYLISSLLCALFSYFEIKDFKEWRKMEKVVNVTKVN